MVFALHFALASDRRRHSPALTLRFGVAFLVGPLALLVLNLAHGAPALLTPQHFLLKVLRYTDRLHYFHEGPVHASVLSLLADRPEQVIRQITKNGFYYLKSFGETGRGSAYLLPLAPWALYRAIGRERLRYLALPLALGAVDLVFYVLLWPTFDADRFMILPHLMMTVAIVTTLATANDEKKSDQNATDPRSFISLTLFAVLAIWFVRDGYRSYLAMRERQIGRPYSNFVESLWGIPEVRKAQVFLRDHPSMSRQEVIASNEPWLVHRISGLPTVLIPYDLEKDEWISFIGGYEARTVFIHRVDWPPGFLDRLGQLEVELQAAGWIRDFQDGPISIWSVSAL
jgi:hypothetical protein